MARFSTVRAAIVLLAICACFGLLVARVIWLQTEGREQTLRMLERQHQQKQVLRARRGSIFDRNGIEMAGTVQTRAVFIDPKFMMESYRQDNISLLEMDRQLALLGRVIDRDAYELSQLVSDRNSARFVKVADNVDDETCRRVMQLNIPGVGVTPVDVRHYPMGSLAAHVLGGCGRDGNGLEGMELKFDKTLRGQNGYLRATADAQHRPLSVAAEDYRTPEHGRHLVLTIDANIQLIAEQELAATCREYKAKRGEVVVMDPRSGEILALANYPTFNPQNLEDTATLPELRRNNALVAPYEPGSTLKPFVLGPALRQRVTKLDEVWPLAGRTWRTPYGRTITDVHGYGPLSSWDGLVKSSNVLMSMLAGRMGNKKLHEALTSWGFGQPTGVELPGEDAGRLNPLKKWNKYTTESVAQGYEIMVTPVQLARAFAVYANGGRLVTPTLIRGTLDDEGKVVSDRSVMHSLMAPEVLDRITAAEVKRVLADVVVRGTATKARSDTWNVFGKTGTAHISEGRGGYSPDRYVSSFLCGAPYEDPRLVAAFIIHEPDKTVAHYGGTVSAPGAMRMMERSLAYLQVPPSPPLPLPPPSVAKVLHNYKPEAYKPKKPENSEPRAASARAGG